MIGGEGVRKINNDKKGVVFNIQKYTVHDGPGIRTEIFMKGCFLKCQWCSNPESLRPLKQVGVFSSKCIGISKCGFCVDACQEHGREAFIIEGGRVVGIDRKRCDDCALCEAACPSNALKTWGKEMTVEEVMSVIVQDMNYYKKSGGGVTISGGEALYQWAFTKEILEACRQKGIHTCVESALHVEEKVLEAILPSVDLLITDIKHMDSTVHKKYTGAGNAKILKNIETVVKRNIPVVLRIPVIPEVNDQEEHFREIGRFIIEKLDNRLVQVQCLRFRRLGEEKYRSLGLDYKMTETDPDRGAFEERIKGLVLLLRDMGIPAVAGTTQKINL